MLRRLFFAAAAAFVAVHALDDEELSASALDFFKPEYRSGLTYIQSSNLHQTSTFEEAGQQMEQVMDMIMSNEMSVEDVPEGGKEITLTYTHIAMDMVQMGVKIHYDSNEESSSQNNNPFAMLNGLMGEPITILVDDDYKVAKIESGSDLLSKLQSNEITKDLASAKQFEQTTSLVRSLPAIGVKPGDTWPFDIELQGDLMHFTGQGVFDGYVKCGPSSEQDCAEIDMEGEMDMDLGQIGNAMGNNAIASVMSQTKVKEGKMSTNMLWDVNDHIARSTKLETSMIMEMPDPMGSSKTMEIPIHQTMETTMEIMV